MTSKGRGPIRDQPAGPAHRYPGSSHSDGSHPPIPHPASCHSDSSHPTEQAKPPVDLIGAVLCGGGSKRMGRDKGSLQRDGTPWAQIMAEKLEPFGIPVFFSINPVQQERYSSFISPQLLIVDALPLAGPMKGLLSVHERFPSKDILLLACDMLDLDKATISGVLDARRSDDRYDFYVYGGTAFAQPFCGLYTARGLAPLYGSATSLTDLSLQSLLRRGKTNCLEIARQEAFANYNSLEAGWPGRTDHYRI